MRQIETQRPRRELLGWAERKSSQLFAMSMRAAAAVIIGVGTYVLCKLLVRVFEVLDKILELIGGCLR